MCFVSGVRGCRGKKQSKQTWIKKTTEKKKTEGSCEEFRSPTRRVKVVKAKPPRTMGEKGRDGEKDREGGISCKDVA